MHPLIVTPLYPPAIGGAATYFGIVAPGLAGHPAIDRVTVLTERLPGQPVEWSDGKLRVLRRLPTRAGVAQRGRWARTSGYARTQWWFHAHFGALRRQLGADVIHLHTRYGGRLLYSALQRSRAPVIANLHDKLTAPFSLTGVADTLLCCAEGVRRFASQGGFPDRRTVLLPLPLVVPPLPPPAQVAATCSRYGMTPATYLLFVGDITARKGVYDLLDAFRRWQPPSTIGLVFVGANWEGERFLREVRGSRGVSYLGPVPRDDAWRLMRGAAIVVLPSHNEALPYVILEAVAMGTRVICPPGIPEFERHLPDAILPTVNAEAILRVLQSVLVQKKLPSYPMSEHNPERVLSGLVNLYEEVGRRHGHGI
jgi:glycosyltransferase involved in cell wall biosynthesis